MTIEHTSTERTVTDNIRKIVIDIETKEVKANVFVNGHRVAVAFHISDIWSVFTADEKTAIKKFVKKSEKKLYDLGIDSFEKTTGSDVDENDIPDLM